MPLQIGLWSPFLTVRIDNYHISIWDWDLIGYKGKNLFFSQNLFSVNISADYIVNLFITFNETIHSPLSFRTFVLQFLICFVFEYMKLLKP